MMIKFNGVYEKRKKGCSVCGRKNATNGFTTVKTYILPSGITKTFRAGRCEEVSQMDAEFLLTYRCEDETGIERFVFEVCDG